MEEKELTPNEIRGIDLIVKSLKKKYNFITGWKVEDDYTKYNNTLFINLEVDIEKVSDYYGFRIRPIIKKLMQDRESGWYGRGLSNPTVYLDLPEGNDDGYQSKKQMNEMSNILYRQLPPQLQRTYISGEYEHLVTLNFLNFIVY
jgi:hypothetical protein